MARIQPIDPRKAEGESKQVLDETKAMVGRLSNLIKTMAHAPSVLTAFLDFSGALNEGTLSPELRERIALAVGEAAECHYCVAAHTAISKMKGLDEEDILNSRKGKSGNKKEQAAIHLALKIVEKRGWISDDDFTEAKNADLSDAEIIEVVANTAINLFTNYFNHIVDPALDFPKPPPSDCPPR
jgi:uncharacterized peroxidase-related enzyme